jgi:hypothetical protein
MNVRMLQKIGQDLAIMVKDYSGGPQREMLIDPALYARFRATGRSVERQFPAHLPGCVKPARIDFRFKAPNAVLIEFAVRPPKGGGHLCGSQNRDELCKLTRFSNSDAKLRALLLVDLRSEPHDLEALWATYKQINAGPGHFARHPVQVVYTHATTVGRFRWTP